jgi:hypothetical protein
VIRLQPLRATASSARQEFQIAQEFSWRKRVGVEPTNDGIARRSPVLKTVAVTGPHALPQALQTKATEKSELHIDVHS